MAYKYDKRNIFGKKSKKKNQTYGKEKEKMNKLFLISLFSVLLNGMFIEYFLMKNSFRKEND